MPGLRRGAVVQVRHGPQERHLAVARELEAVEQPFGELLGLLAQHPGQPHRTRAQREGDGRLLVARGDRVLGGLAHVGVIGQHGRGELAGRLAAVERRDGRRHQGREVAPMPRPRRVVLAAGAQLIRRERPHQLEQLAAALGLPADEAGLEQLVDLGADRAVRDGLERRPR